MSKKLLALLASAILIALACFGIASAAGQSAPSPSAATAPNILRARVNPDGSIVKGTTGTSSDKINTGDYFVHFDQNVGGCIYEGTPSSRKSAITPHDPAMIAISPRYSSTKEVLVQTFGPGGADADHGFDLVVFCWS
jgi:hypothetical protein